ncbi:helix-turn-helix domain-containing protein [Halospina sp. K52047b]|nr:helix-turn-helix domain-containing protein [Halospina sp. K52047b]
MGYRQLTQRRRYQIEAGLQHQCSLGSIAQTIGCSSSTVSREIRRNSGASGYCPEVASVPIHAGPRWRWPARG